ncbi:hypothetical protein CRM22_001937, partial [Opisthorchis felineus]
MTVKLIAPLFIHRLHFHLKILLTCALALNSFIVVSFSTSMTMSIIGILSASLSCGIGDVSFLSMTAFFHRNCVSAWSSGTGAAGLIGALSYAALTSALSPETTLLLVTMVPVTLLLVYFFLLARPDHPKFQVQCRCFRRNYDTLMKVEPGIHDRLSVLSSDGQLRATRSNDPEEYEVYVRDSQSRTGLNNEDASDDRPIVPADNVDLQQQHPSLKVKLRILKDLAGLLIFLSLVYFFEYIINQSL